MDTGDENDLRLSKLKEMFALTADPLLENLNHTPQADPNILAIPTTNPLELKHLIDGSLGSKLEDCILRAVEQQIFKKRPSSQHDSPAKKKPRLDNRETHNLLRFNHQKPFKQSAVESLKSQEQVSQEEMDEFLSKDISELEILSLPEHYPTQPHTVSSLAELYYLTQTLPLIKLLPGSHKALMTENFELALLEGKIAVLYSRIEELKRQGKWSLRQPQRFYDPFTHIKKTKKYVFHWDSLLEEAKWMATDFKESLKFKKACSVLIAHAVKDYWKYGKVVCVKRKPIVHLLEKKEEPVATVNPENILKTSNSPEDMEIETAEQVKVNEAATVAEVSVSAPEDKEEGSKDAESTVPALRVNATGEVPILCSMLSPEEIEIRNEIESHKIPFNLHVDVNELKKIDQSIIKNLPKYTPFGEEIHIAPSAPQLGSSVPPAEVIPAAAPTPALKSGVNSMVPVSRLLHPFEDDDDWYKVVLKESNNKKTGKNSSNTSPPEYQKGLFGFQSRRRFSYLKPPKPPLIKNIDYRSPTIWLPQDDKHLIHYVAEFCFNWDLIAEHLLSLTATLKTYKSNIERRTPWQCFERYIQLNEKFQFSDMKGVYAYHAQKWLEHAHKAQLTTKRRISPLGVGTESIQRGHRRLRWASLFDAMRKCMKKREIAAAKMNSKRPEAGLGGTATSQSGNVPSETNTPAAGNGGTSSPGTRPVLSSSLQTGSGNQSPNLSKRPVDRIPTPAELSKLKFDRDKTIQEAYVNQQATRTRMMAAVSQQQRAGAARTGANVPGALGAATQANARAGISAGVGASSSSQAQNTKMANPLPPGLVPGQQGPSSQAQAMMNKVPTTPNGTPYTPEQIQQLLQKQRRMMQQNNLLKQNASQGSDMLHASVAGKLPQQGQQGQLPSLSIRQQGHNMAPQQIPNLAMSSPGAQTVQPSAPIRTGLSLPQPQGAQQLQSGVPRARIQFAPAQVSAIINSIQQKNPGFTKEQVTKLAAQYLANLQQLQQNRLNQQQAQQQQQGRFNNSQQASKPQQAPVSVSSLTPQERSQLQRLKAAKSAQQLQNQQLQLGLSLDATMLQQQQLQQLQQRKVNDMPAMSRLEYEQRKNAMIQKQQQLQQQARNQTKPGQSPTGSR